MGAGFLNDAGAQTLGTYTINPTRADQQVVPGFYPNLELDLAYDDNILRTDSGTIDSWILEARPELQWVGVMGKHFVRLGYQGYYGWYDASSSEDFNDHYLGADTTLDLTQKLNINLTADYRREHEPRSVATLATPTLGTPPNLWEQWAAAGEVVYGRRIAKAQVALKGVHQDRQYLNNGQAFRDYVSDGLTLTFYYNLGPKTQLLVEPSFTRYNYSSSLSTQDNDVRRLLVGVTWDATAKTTGEFKIGHHDKRFDNGVGDTSGLSTEAKVIWRPRTYSKVTGTLSRFVYDSALAGSQAFEAVIAGVDWEHDLTGLTQLQLGLQYEQDSYDQGREDDLANAYLGISYAVKRWLTVGARYDHARRDSTAAGADFSDNRFAIGIKTTLD